MKLKVECYNSMLAAQIDFWRGLNTIEIGHEVFPVFGLGQVDDIWC